MGKGERARSRGRTRPSGARWWIVGIAVTALVAGASVVYFARPHATAGPHEVAVNEIEHTHGLAVDPSNSNILWIGTHGSLIRVTGGKQWMRIGRQRYDMMGFNVHPAQPNLLITSGHPGSGDGRPNPLGVEISRDGGQTWQPLALPGEADFHTMAMSRADPNVLYAWNVSGRRGLYRSRDGGGQWDYLGARDLEGVIYLAAHPARAKVAYAGTVRGLYVSEDAGETWRPYSPALTGVPVTAVEVHPKDPQTMYAYAARPELGLIRSDDGGKQWTSVGFFLRERDAVGNLALDPTEPRVLYFATHGGDLYRSQDGGKSRSQWVSRGKVVAP